jgi:hypothetical protein
MRKLLRKVILLSLIFTVFVQTDLNAQCTNATINWDNLDYLTTGGSYSGWVTNTMRDTQSFAIGVNRMLIKAPAAFTKFGELTNHTGSGGSPFSGADVAFDGNGTMQFIFDNPVTNLQFSLYDIDNSETATVTATNAAGTGVPITMTRATGVWPAIAGSGTNTAVATGRSIDYAFNSNGATANVTITEPVKTVNITMANMATTYVFLSDIQACVTGSFPTNYFAVSQPFTGQPAYVLAVHDLNTVYMIDPATGSAVSVFTDNTPRVGEINDLAYDPYKRIIYYSVDGIERQTPAGTPDTVRYIRKYDLNTETISQIINNVNAAPFNIPTYTYGLQSGGAAFYNGSLYIGVEGSNGTGTSAREGAVWRIDFAADSITPIKASQVFASPADNGAGTIAHDWGDFTMKDGIMYDFNTSGSTALGNFIVYNMQTENTTTYISTALHQKPRQVAQQWNGNLYCVFDSIASYDGTNVLSAPPARPRIVAAAGSPTWVASAGDAAEAFRPKADFGDAPATYDPVALSPAMHERDTALYLGSAFSSGWDWEWNKQTSADATGDGADDNDGLTFIPVFDKTTGQFLVQARIYNNTGSAATLMAWFDYNGDGDYDASEAVGPITVNSMPSVQLQYLYWSGISSSIPNGNNTFLRIRLTTASGMGAANATGYFQNGEVEDYRILVDNYPLSANLLSFTANTVSSSTVQLNWETAAEQDIEGYTIQRSNNGTNWNDLGFVNAKANNLNQKSNYQFVDANALKGSSYYRLLLVSRKPAYSEIRNIVIKDGVDKITIAPNPASNIATISFTSIIGGEVTVVIRDMQGRKVKEEKRMISAGRNSIIIDNLSQYAEGVYPVQVTIGSEIVNQKLVIRK